ncbi:MAG TPA: lysozyme inhibitor LprI family protein [Rhizomicrobium sp.]|jgi:uncharacterized protein YecT (DUF1311 family)|nr:lysozyme inhibitor LprI family protein [Rhizomicrobium sp.]
MLTAMLLVGMQLVAAQPGNCLSGDADDNQRFACAEAYFKGTDALLNKVYAATLQKYQAYDAIARRLHESHASFLKWRENSCAVKPTPKTEASYRAVKLQCMANMNRSEIGALQEDRPLP